MVRLAPAELDALLGPLPVLSTEDPKRFEAVLTQLLACLKPEDTLERLLIKQYAHESWFIERYSRHTTLGVERYHRQSREFLAEQLKQQEARKEAHAMHNAERKATPTDIARLVALENTVLGSVKDVDDILERKATEMEHNRALEKSGSFLELLDRLINSATKRRNDTLVLLDHYRAGLGRRVREVTTEIIDAELAAEDQATKEIVDAGLVIEDQVTKEVIGAELAPGARVTEEIIDAESTPHDHSTKEITNAELVAVNEANKEIGAEEVTEDADAEQLTGAALAAEIARDQTRHISDRRWPNGYPTENSGQSPQ
jgi:hypothetical protein